MDPQREGSLEEGQHPGSSPHPQPQSILELGQDQEKAMGP